MCRVRVLLEWVKDKGEARSWRAYTGLRRSFGGRRREFCLGKPLGGLGGFWLGLARVLQLKPATKKVGFARAFLDGFRSAFTLNWGSGVLGWGWRANL